LIDPNLSHLHIALKTWQVARTKCKFTRESGIFALFTPNARSSRKKAANFIKGPEKIAKDAVG
jgi:hypothetical protein